MKQTHPRARKGKARAGNREHPEMRGQAQQGEAKAEVSEAGRDSSTGRARTLGSSSEDFHTREQRFWPRSPPEGLKSLPVQTLLPKGARRMARGWQGDGTDTEHHTKSFGTNAQANREPPNHEQVPG